nr:MAG TPA: Protein of unknown function (DUF2615) [Inoviridae sp.]
MPWYQQEVTAQSSNFFSDCLGLFDSTFSAMWGADTDFFRVLFTAIVMFMIFALILYLMNHTKK